MVIRHSAPRRSNSQEYQAGGGERRLPRHSTTEAVEVTGPSSFFRSPLPVRLPPSRAAHTLCPDSHKQTLNSLPFPAYERRIVSVERSSSPATLIHRQHTLNLLPNPEAIT